MIEAGAAQYGGDFDGELRDHLRAAVAAVAADPVMRARMTSAASAMVDGRGAQRVAEAVS